MEADVPWEEMPIRLRAKDGSLIAGAAIGGVLVALALVTDSDAAMLAGAGVLTVSSCEGFRRMWLWIDQRENSRPEGDRMREWEMRKEYLALFLGCAAFVVVMCLGAGQTLLALLTFPAAVLLLGSFMIRGRLVELLWAFLYPDRTTRTDRHPRR